MEKYRISDLMSDYSFELEMSEETYKVIKTIQDNLGYVMDDINIERL